jgi:ATP-dependent Clp protease ATP-binding subunit ClpC
MVTRRLQVCVITESLGDSGVLGQALLFPDLYEFDSKAARVASVTARRAGRVYRHSNRLTWWQHHRAGIPDLQTVTVTLHPPRHAASSADQTAADDAVSAPESVRWCEPLTLTWPVLAYASSDGAALAYIPALGIQVIAPDPAQLAARLPDETLAALRRSKFFALGFDLAFLAQRSHARLHDLSIDLPYKPPRQLLDDQSKKQDSGPTELDKVSTPLHDRHPAPAFEISRTVAEIAQALVGPPGQSVLLIGPSGVGKSAAIRELARTRQDYPLHSTPFYLTSGSRLVAGMSGFGMWQERCLKICQEAIKQNAVLILGNLMELMEVGKSQNNPQGLASYFAPYCQRGQIRALVECTPQQLQIIQRRDPRLAEAFLHIQLAQPSPKVCRTILELATAKPAADRDTLLLPEALDTTIRLHQRYAGYSTNPGRPLGFLNTLLSAHAPGSTLGANDVITAFTAHTGLPRLMLDDQLPMDPPTVEAWFRERVIGQPGPVAAVTSALARAKARLTRPGRPIASLLFIGPTGVGKTETAKALAEYLFSSPDRMVRIDMSEYADPWAAGRLAGDSLGSEGYLTSRVREQPFGVVLLDEFEKAHPDVFDLLLQVLGEGRLTDASGRLADFTNSVIIMTSNLGAQTYNQTGFGFSPSQSARTQAAAHFTEEVRKRLRPELFNRIDAVVPFAPLDEATALNITRRELDKALMRDGFLNRKVTIDISDEAATQVARAGFDVRYGARPLKRAIQERVITPLAQALNRYAPGQRLHAAISWADHNLQVTVKTVVSDDATSRTASSTAQLAQSCQSLRRSMQRVQQSPPFAAARNELFRLTRENDAHLKLVAKLSRVTTPPGTPNKRLLKELAANLLIQQQLKPLQSLLTSFETLQTAVEAAEEALILALCQRASSPTSPDLASNLAACSRDWESWLTEFYFITQDLPSKITLMLFCEDDSWLSHLARAYLSAMPQGSQGRLMQLHVDYSKPPLPESDRIDTGAWSAATRHVYPSVVDSVAEMLDRPSGVIGVALEITGARAAALFSAEDGIHALQTGLKNKIPCLVRATTQTIDIPHPPKLPKPLDLSGLQRDVTRVGALSGVPESRILDPKDSRLRCLETDQSLHCPYASMIGVLGPWLQKRLRQRIHAYASAGEQAL